MRVGLLIIFLLIIPLLFLNNLERLNKWFKPRVIREWEKQQHSKKDAQ